MRKLLMSCALVVATSLHAQTTQPAPDLAKSIDQLNETQKAILKELRDIKMLLANQQRQAILETLPPAPIDIANDPFKGSPNAKVAVVEFSEFQCPFCGRFNKDTLPQIVRDYIDTGKIRYVWRDLPLSIHENAAKAAEAARCAGEQGKFWEMHDRLFANQQTIGAADLPKHAEALQLNAEQFKQCLDSGRYSPQIQKSIAYANSIGVSGTPTFFFGVVQPNGSVKVSKKLVGAKSYAEFKSALDSLLAE